MNDSIEIPEEEARPLWKRLDCGNIARFCHRRKKRVAPDGTNGKSRKDSRRRINRPPSVQYTSIGEFVRTNAPPGMQCALFCGGARCKYELPIQQSSAIQGLYSDWITEDIVAMARPSTSSIAARNIIQQFHSWGIRTVINLQMPGEHASCGPPLTNSGFTYDPVIFMANDIFYYNFAWPDYGEASLSGLLDMAKVFSFALQEGRVAVHCHAGILIYKYIYEPKAGVCRCDTKLDGKVALITGGNSGIGFETAKDLARRGAKVIIADVQNADKTVADIIHTTGNTKVEYRKLDLAKFSSIKTFADEFNKTIDHLDILVNNAGTVNMSTHFTGDGINTIMQINYFGPFLLTALLMDRLVASKSSRIVIVSSAAHCYAKFDIHDIIGAGEVDQFTLYANSKLCNMLWMRALDKRLPQNVTVNTVHPGIVKTDIYNHLPILMRTFLPVIINFFFKTPKQGAQTSIHVCVSRELEHSSGNHYANCKIKGISREGRNPELAEKVWLKTVKLLGKYYSEIK